MRFSNPEETLKTVGLYYEICEKEYIRQLDRILPIARYDDIVFYNCCMKACELALATAYGIRTDEVEMRGKTSGFLWNHLCQLLTVSHMEAHGYPLAVIRKDELRDENNLYPITALEGGEELLAELISIAEENN